MNKVLQKSGFAHKAFALLAMAALVLGMVPMQSFAQESAPTTEPGIVETPVETPAEEPQDQFNMMSFFGGWNHPPEPQIDICHREFSGGYANSKQSVDQSSILGGRNAHDGHSTGGYNNIGDIIPPFGAYLGKNWDALGQSIWNNNCKTTGTIIVDKIVVGTTTVKAKDFILKVGTEEVKDNDGEAFAPGTYTVTETPKKNTPAPVAVTFGGACDAQGNVTVAIGETKTCTITNDYTPVPTKADLTITKVVVGTTTVDESSFSFILNNGNAVAFNTNGTNVINLDLGNYSVVESNVVSGKVTVGNYEYTVDYSAGCSGTLAGATTCTITNTLVPDLCPNLPGTQNPVPQGKVVDQSGNCVDEDNQGPDECTVEVYSDDTDFVVETDAFAKLLTTINGGWTAVVAAPSKWIWGDDPVVAPTTADETQTFVKKFGFEGTVTSAELRVAADNSHQITLNGDAVGGDATEYNYKAGNEDVYDITGLIEQGNNELEIAVTNWGLTPSTPASNPAGLKYKLVINGTVTDDEDCDVPYDDDGGPRGSGVLQIIKDVEGSDTNENTFSYVILNGTRFSNDVYQATTSFPTGGVVNLTVPSGTYTVVETDPGANWTETYNNCSETLVAPNGTTTCTITNTFDGDNGGNDVPGCTDRLATNYNPAATVNDQSCDYNYVSQCVETPANLLTNGSFEEDYGLTDGNWGIFNPVLGWDISLSDGLEIWRNMFAGPSEGEQNAELDGNNATKITQTVNGLTSGATYELRFDFAARTADELDNRVEAAIDGVELLDIATDNTNWTTYGKTFVATSTSANISFVDLGTAQDNGGTGTLLDNAVLCLVDEGEGGGEETDTYKVFGYVWNDDNRNEQWDGRFPNEGEEEPPADGENDLDGWVVRITNGQQSFETVTDENGYYEFNVPAGTWTITEVIRDGWMRTTAESHTVTVPEVDEASEEETIFETAMNFLIPTAHAAAVIVKTTYGEYNFGNDRRGGGGGNRAGDRDNDDDNDGRVLGDSDSVTPEPLVLGEQVSAVPTGAPDAGAGGAAPKAVEIFSLGSLAILGRSRKNA